LLIICFLNFQTSKSEADIIKVARSESRRRWLGIFRVAHPRTTPNLQGQASCLPYPAASLPPEPQKRTRVINSLPHHQNTRLASGAEPTAQSEAGRYGSQRWLPLRWECPVTRESSVKIARQRIRRLEQFYK
jgi:hypothetical protein